jgi:hypothetical protein
MKKNGAAACDGCGGMTRREFVAGSSASVVSASLAGGLLSGPAASGEKIRQKGPASQCVPRIRACFVRRKGDYGMRWPGQIYDGEAARRKYIQQITAAAKDLGLRLDLRPQPLYSLEEATAWTAETVDQSADGLLMVLLDRQEHAWPSAQVAIESRVPAVIFSPVGSSFTSNTAGLAKAPGSFIASTDDFRQVRYGMKMLHAGAKMRATRCLVIWRRDRMEKELPHLGIKLRYLPAQVFIDEYEKMPVDDKIRAMAKDLIDGARKQIGATEQDVINGIKSYLVAATLLEREECDAITMDCLGALGPTKISLPCIAWSKMNDDGIPAACEADLGAVASHTIVQYLFDRPGFQQDPVAETARQAVIGAHCSCPTRLQGFSSKPETYDIVHHHGVRDATARPVWRIGQRATSVDVLLKGDEAPPEMLISAGEVIDNVSVPPAGGCVVSVMIRFDGATDVLTFPGFHHVFFYGDFKRELVQFCQLFGITPTVV